MVMHFNYATTCVILRTENADVLGIPVICGKWVGFSARTAVGLFHHHNAFIFTMFTFNFGSQNLVVYSDSAGSVKVFMSAL